MDISIVYSRAQAGMDAPLVEVETHLANGLPSFAIVGLPETAVRESRERVRAAITNSHFEFPSDRRITVNLAPADLPKEGGRFDLPIALGILCASGQVAEDKLPSHEFIGELALDGKLRAVPAVVTAAIAATDATRHLVVPASCAQLAAQVPTARVIAAPELLHLCAHLNGAEPIAATPAPPAHPAAEYPDLRDVVGQDSARRALEVAAAGGHNLLLIGPPGTGKTLLASRLPGILPPNTPAQTLECLALHNSFQREHGDYPVGRPFRAPHHSASAVALVGGGAQARPGEISLAHSGVLFLDELPEFSRHTLEMLREPLESGRITLSRANRKVTYPARFQLIAAMNPCPCGYLDDPENSCKCTPEQIQKYRKRISGPLLDRMDLRVTVNRPPINLLLATDPFGEGSAEVRARVCTAHELQKHRQSQSNATLNPSQLATHCKLATTDQLQLERACRGLKLSARGLHRVLRVARTIADLAGDKALCWRHIAEALALREQ
jgi:magnesium chelatase family protein